jgi:hypothetical protein
MLSDTGRTEISILFSTKRSAYSDMSSFLSQSAICCIAATKLRRGLTEVLDHSKPGVYTDLRAIARTLMSIALAEDLRVPAQSAMLSRLALGPVCKNSQIEGLRPASFQLLCRGLERSQDGPLLLACCDSLLSEPSMLVIFVFSALGAAADLGPVERPARRRHRPDPLRPKMFTGLTCRSCLRTTTWSAICFGQARPTRRIGFLGHSSVLFPPPSTCAPITALPPPATTISFTRSCAIPRPANLSPISVSHRRGPVQAIPSQVNCRASHKVPESHFWGSIQKLSQVNSSVSSQCSS